MYRMLLTTGLLLIASHASLYAQAPPGWDPKGLQLTRPELQQLLAEYEATVASPSYGDELRERARDGAELIRQRLEEGDLRIGDRVLIRVEGYPQLSDTFNVVAGRMVVLPDIGEVQLAGVLRSELTDHLAAQIGRFIREPIVQARALIRLEIMGAVGRPGFYAIPSDILITDALMMAGGPAQNAKIDEIRIERGERVIWDGETLRQAVIDGRTLDQLNVRAGDAIRVPQDSGRFATVRTVLVVVSGVVSMLVLASQAGMF